MADEDWKECRTTIGRLDTILEDLRKVGFSIITGLLTASTFLNFLGTSTTPGVSAPTTDVRAVVFIIVMVLVAALFSVDTYYQVLLSGAVERALDLEAQTTNPPLRVTKYLSNNATRSGISFIILALYIVLLATAEGMGLFATGLNDLAFAWPGTWVWVPGVGIGILVVGIIAAFRAYRKDGPKPHRLPLVVIILLSALTIVVAMFLPGSPAADPSGVRHWMVAVGMFLATYIQYYWLYSAWQSGLYSQKQRKWQAQVVPPPAA
jgi:hypothetical protein